MHTDYPPHRARSRHSRHPASIRAIDRNGHMDSTCTSRPPHRARSRHRAAVTREVGAPPPHCPSLSGVYTARPDRPVRARNAIGSGVRTLAVVRAVLTTIATLTTPLRHVILLGLLSRLKHFCTHFPKAPRHTASSATKFTARRTRGTASASKAPGEKRGHAALPLPGCGRRRTPRRMPPPPGCAA